VLFRSTAVRALPDVDPQGRQQDRHPHPGHPPGRRPAPADGELPATTRTHHGTRQPRAPAGQRRPDPARPLTGLSARALNAVQQLLTAQQDTAGAVSFTTLWVLCLPITGRYIPVMRSEAPALMPIFRSQHQAALLAWLLLHPEDEYTLTELAKRLDVPLTTLQREAQRLVGAGILQDRTLGRARLLRANLSNRAAAPLTQLLQVAFGPETVIGEEFDLTNAEQVLICGSWADRYHGTPGPPPNDVDVLVVGSLDRADVYDAADRAQARLGMQVNPVIRTPEQWAND